LASESNNSKRIDQWFIRGIGLVVSGLFLATMIFVLIDFEQGLFFNDGLYPDTFDYILVAKYIGKFLWTFRVLDLILVVIILMLVMIAAYYLVGYKTMVEKQPKQERRYREW